MAMRQLLAITVAFLIGLPVFAPFIPNVAPIVPICCRRAGQHHCMSRTMQRNGAGQAMDEAAAQENDRPLDQDVAFVGPACPRFPVASVAPQALGLLAQDVSGVGTACFVRPASLPQTEARYRIAFARSRQKRGPPARPFLALLLNL